jgi:ABC-type branched-subunit amino acid transport system substrate-binding protein
MKANNGCGPNFHSLGGYDGMHLIYEAVKKAGPTANGEQLVEAMKGLKWVSPRGPMSIDPGDAAGGAERLSARSEDGQRQAVERRVRDLREREGSGQLIFPAPPS